MRSRLAVLVALALVGSWAPAAPAAALGPGVHVDPGSPAGKEYTPPLSTLRGQANGNPAAGGQPQSSFGIGITPAGGRPGGSGASLASQVPGRRAAQTSALGGRGGGTRGLSGGAGAAGRGVASGVGQQTGTGATSGSPTSGAASARLATTGSAFPSVALVAAVVLLGGLVLGGVLVLARRRLD